MPNLVRHYRSALMHNAPRLGSRHGRAISDAAAEGLEAATRIRLAAHATHVGLVGLSVLCREEDRLVRTFAFDDVGAAMKVEARARLLIDTFTSVAAAELADLGE